MKGLVEVSPGVARVKVGARAARKHYGIVIDENFVDGLHDAPRK